MTAPATTQTAPSLDEKLRFIDITFDSIRIAERDLIAAGLISRLKPYESEMPTPRGKRIALQAYRIMAETVLAEGLNPAVITNELCRQAYDDLTRDTRRSHLRVVEECGL